MWTNGQTKRNKRFQYGKWHLHTSLTPLYGSVMASRPLTAFVGFPHFHWNCETDRCLPACIHSLSHFLLCTLFSLSLLLSSPQIIFHYFVSHSPSVGKGRYSSTELLSKTLLLTNCHLSVSDERRSNSFFLCPWPSLSS